MAGAQMNIRMECQHCGYRGDYDIELVEVDLLLAWLEAELGRAMRVPDIGLLAQKKIDTLRAVRAKIGDIFGLGG